MLTTTGIKHAQSRVRHPGKYAGLTNCHPLIKFSAAELINF